MKKRAILTISFLLLNLTNLQSKRVLTVGGAQKDMFIRCVTESNSAILGGQKVEIKNPTDYTSTGGGAVNSSIAFKRRGFMASTFFKLGNDTRSKLFIKKLESEGVSTQNIVYTSEDGTGVSFIIPSPDHDNCVLIYRGSNVYLGIEDIPVSEIKRSNIVYITSLNGESMDVLLPIVQTAKEAKAVTAINPGGTQLRKQAPILKDILSNIDILLLNEKEAKILMKSLTTTDEELKRFLLDNKSSPKDLNAPILLRTTINDHGSSFTLKQFFKIVLNLGPKIVIVTNGADGVYTATKNKIYYHPSLPAQVVSTTGAGDAFGAGFVATLLKHNKTIEEAIQNKTIETAINHGILNSTSVISYMNTNKGLLNSEELSVKSKEIGTSLLQRFSLEE